MVNNVDFPSIESYLPAMMGFVANLVQGYQSGDISSWPVMSERVHAFFTREMLDRVDTIAPGWRDMSAYAEGVTLVHVMSVFTALLLCPEFQDASPTQQVLMKWAVFFHDIAKEVQGSQRDLTHGFRSAAMTGAILSQPGFSVPTENDSLIEDWLTLTSSATVKQGDVAIYIQDNRKLPVIIDGVEKIFGHNTPAALIVKTVLFHMSINVVKEWPQAAPLSRPEMRQYLDGDLLPLLKTMMLVDNDGWSFFDQPTKERYRRETLTVFEELENIIAE